MKPPRFTDSARFRVPYVPAAATNIRATFARIERERIERKRTQKNRRRAPGHRGAVIKEIAR